MDKSNPLRRADKKHIGSHYENLACQYLIQQGLTLLAKNSQYPLGELDLIMQDNTCLVFVEVRYRKNDHFGVAAATITANKQAKVVKASHLWMQSQNISAETAEYRFDVFAITGNDIQWVINAFSF